jgi:hypothetical protein
VGGALPPEQVGPGSGRRPVGRRAFLRLAGASTVGGALAPDARPDLALLERILEGLRSI